jgi:Lrp/AsnC family leucine-responsive transcriptional regulator
MAFIELDAKDQKILFAFSLNARQPLANVAKELGLSKQVVVHRLERLEKSGVIEGYYAIVNINKLGYLYYRIFFKFQNVNPVKEEEIIDYCRKHTKIGWVFQLDGEWDFAVAVWVKDLLEFEEILDELQNKFGRFIHDKHISISTTIHHLKQKYLIGKEDNTELVLGGPPSRAKLDDLDYEILGLLTKNGRLSLLKMGDALKTDPKVISYRLQKLMNEGIILGFNVKINHRLLGFTHQKVFLNLTNISEESRRKLIEYLKNLTSSIYITKAVGVADLEFELMVKSNEESHYILRQLRYEYSAVIRSYTSFIIYDEPYINYLPQKK